MTTITAGLNNGAPKVASPAKASEVPLETRNLRLGLPSKVKCDIPVAIPPSPSWQLGMY